MNRRDGAVQGRSEQVPYPVTWWRKSYERDLDSFVRAHGRRPESLDELMKWLVKPVPVRSEFHRVRTPESD